MSFASVKGLKMKQASPHLEQKKGEEKEKAEAAEIIRQEEERGPEEQLRHPKDPERGLRPQVPRRVTIGPE